MSQSTTLKYTINARIKGGQDYLNNFLLKFSEEYLSEASRKWVDEIRLNEIRAKEAARLLCGNEADCILNLLNFLQQRYFIQRVIQAKAQNDDTSKFSYTTHVMIYGQKHKEMIAKSQCFHVFETSSGWSLKSSETSCNTKSLKVHLIPHLEVQHIQSKMKSSKAHLRCFSVVEELEDDCN